MLRDITIGQFFPGISFVHRLDPRVKISLTMMLVVLIFFVRSFAGFAVVALFVFGASALSKLPFAYLLRGIKPLWPLLILTFILNLFSTKGANVWWSWRFITISSEGLQLAIFYSLRLMLLVFTTSLMTLTTSPLALTDGIEQLLKPLKKIRFPVHELAMIMSIALRMIPTLLEETEKIMKAQKARGADFESGNLFQRAKSLVPLLVPLFISAFRRAEELAMAMEARCYRGDDGRTRMKVLHTTRSDWYAVGVGTVMGLLIMVDFIWKPL